MTRTVRRPIGGYVFAVFAVLFALILTPYGSWKTIQSGDILSGVLMFVIMIPLMLGMAKSSVALNNAVHVYRQWLRDEHRIIYFFGVFLRGVAIVLTVLGVYLDVTYLSTDVAQAPLLAGFALAMWSMYSVFFSGIARWILPTPKSI